MNDTTDQPEYKTCTKCGQTFPLDLDHFFYRKKEQCFYNWCKKCHNAICLRNKNAKREQYLERRRQRYSENKEVYRGHRMKYYYAHRDSENERNKKWISANRNRRRLQRREYMRKWRSENPEKDKVRSESYRARKANALGAHCAEDIKKIYEQQGGRCWYCQTPVGSKYHIDHRIPLSKGGSNNPNNLVVACQSCNCRKQGRMPHEFCGRLL